MQALAFPSVAEALAFPSLNRASLSWVQFDSRGGSAIPLHLVTPGGKITQPPAPARTGYAFSGWYADSALTTAWDFDRIVSSVDITLYARWTAAVWQIVYHLSGGTQNPDNPGSYTIESPDITLSAPARAGYDFSGWYDNSGFLGAPDTVIPAGSTGDRTYYTRWGIIVYQIAYMLNGGENAPGNPSGYTIESSTIPLRDPARPGYAFLGWYASPDFSGDSITVIPHGSTGDISLYARWEIVTYPIGYVLSGGRNSPDNPDSYTVGTPDIVLAGPDRAGYSFAGWFDNAGFQGAPVSRIPRGSTGPRAYYARWAKGVTFPTGREHIDRFSGDPMIF